MRQSFMGGKTFQCMWTGNLIERIPRLFDFCGKTREKSVASETLEHKDPLVFSEAFPNCVSAQDRDLRNRFWGAFD